MIYFIADLHFGHENIIKYENRPFTNAEDMERQIVKRWNATLTNKDTVIVAGDFSLTNREETKRIFDLLNGQKELILGNHDRGRSVTWWKNIGFENVYKYPIIIDNFFMVSHEPMYVNPSMPYANIHGHIHDRNSMSSQHVNVSVERINYTPISFEKIKEQFKAKESNDETNSNN